MEKCIICKHAFGFNEPRYGKKADRCEDHIFTEAKP